MWPGNARAHPTGRGAPPRRLATSPGRTTRPGVAGIGGRAVILVVGGTGDLGGRVALRLSGAGHSVRVLSRSSSDPAAVWRLREAGIECVPGDLRDGTGLRGACRGVEVVVSTASGIGREAPGDTLDAVDHRGQLELVRAAEEAGVQRFVFVSFTMPAGFDLDFPMWAAKRAVEARLRESSLEYAILHPAPFMETWLTPRAGLDHRAGTARVVGDGRNRISFVATDDVARAVAAAAYHPGARNRAFELGGPQALAWLEVVALFEEATGRAFDVECVPAEALRADLDRLSDPKARSLVALTLGTTRDWVTSATEVSQALDLPRSDWMTVEEFVRMAVGVAPRPTPRRY